MSGPAVAGRSSIRTPDQRLRVFVSSTLKELAAERRAARTAIERLAAAPVMFELGARPHPPRELYRAYLEQSDIFVGLYWEKYGWVAPGEDVSGLEDEYNLAPPTMPRLIYIKQSTGTREPRLEELLDRIRRDDLASFKYFTDADELDDLLVTDLAVLLAERFDLSRAAAPTVRRSAPESRTAAPPSLPVPLTPLIDRDEDLRRVTAALEDPGVRLVTLVGPGGIGKTRVALEAARRLAPAFPDGVVFVPLAPIADPAQVPQVLARALGVQDAGEAPLERRLSAALADRRALLVLDNFEQVLAAAPLAASLLEWAPELRLLVTSRALLRLTGEHSIEIGPLELPAARRRPWRSTERYAAAVELLVQRARAVKPDFELTADTADAVEAIVSRLEGVPLAIELAAARLRLLAPGDLLDRLDRSLALLSGGHRDLPPRQQAVRSTIEWSTRLLQPDEQSLLWRLGVFAGRFSLEAVESIAGTDGDVLRLLETLVDGSLVGQQDRNGESYFSLLGTVREYALERLVEQGAVDDVRDRHARYYCGWARGASADLLGARQWERVTELADQRDNLRAAARHLLQSGRWDEVAEFAWSILPYWWMDSLLSEVHGWMQEILRSGARISDRTRAIALGFANTAFFSFEPSPEVVSGLRESAELFERLGAASDAALVLASLASVHLNGRAPDPVASAAALEHALRLFREAGDRWGESVTLVIAGRLELVRGDVPNALHSFQDGLRLAEEQQDFFALNMANTNLAWALLETGSVEQGVPLIHQALRRSLDAGNDQAVAWALEGIAGVAASRGDVDRAGRLIGAASALRDRMGLLERAQAATQIVERIRSAGHGAAFDEAQQHGRTLSVDDAVALAEDVTRVAAEAA